LIGGEGGDPLILIRVAHGHPAIRDQGVGPVCGFVGREAGEDFALFILGGFN